jgi:hypothetical protein
MIGRWESVKLTLLVMVRFVKCQARDERIITSTVSCDIHPRHKQHHKTNDNGHRDSKCPTLSI